MILITDPTNSHINSLDDDEDYDDRSYDSSGSGDGEIANHSYDREGSGLTRDQVKNENDEDIR